MTHEIGDLVIAATRNCFGRPKAAPEGIQSGKQYRIVDIHRGIDGAYDWDDLFFAGFGDRKFCEFDFEKSNGIVVEA